MFIDPLEISVNISQSDVVVSTLLSTSWRTISGFPGRTHVFDRFRDIEQLGWVTVLRFLKQEIEGSKLLKNIIKNILKRF